MFDFLARGILPLQTCVQDTHGVAVIERLWRSVKHEEIYLREHGTLPELKGAGDVGNAWRNVSQPIPRRCADLFRIRILFR
jgi:hypothetical protein